MNNSNSKPKSVGLDQILNFIDSSKGLSVVLNDSGRVKIKQEFDNKAFTFYPAQVSEILERSDSDGKPFIQINFQNETKVLLTDTLVGFKPQETAGLDMARLPKVVTTPDLVSVYDAISESMGSDSNHESEFETLKKVYLAVITGGEKVGFDLAEEREWLSRLMLSSHKASA